MSNPRMTGYGNGEEQQGTGFGHKGARIGQQCVSVSFSASRPFSHVLSQGPMRPILHTREPFAGRGEHSEVRVTRGPTALDGLPLYSTTLRSCDAAKSR